jgi:hypothetical protein
MAIFYIWLEKFAFTRAATPRDKTLRAAGSQRPFYFAEQT